MRVSEIREMPPYHKGTLLFADLHLAVTAFIAVLHPDAILILVKGQFQQSMFVK